MKTKVTVEHASPTKDQRLWGILQANGALHVEITQEQTLTILPDGRSEYRNQPAEQVVVGKRRRVRIEEITVSDILF